MGLSPKRAILGDYYYVINYYFLIINFERYCSTLQTCLHFTKHTVKVFVLHTIPPVLMFLIPDDSVANIHSYILLLHFGTIFQSTSGNLLLF